MNTLSFSKAARANILSIGRYTEQTWGVKQRDIYLGKLFAAFEKLRMSPSSGRPRDELFKGMLCLRAEKHVVYYFFRKKEVFIAGVLHERMEPSLHLLKP